MAAKGSSCPISRVFQEENFWYLFQSWFDVFVGRCTLLLGFVHTGSHVVAMFNCQRCFLQNFCCFKLKVYSSRKIAFGFNKMPLANPRWLRWDNQRVHIWDLRVRGASECCRLLFFADDYWAKIFLHCLPNWLVFWREQNCVGFCIISIASNLARSVIF